MSHSKQTRVLMLNDMEKLDKTLFRLEQGQWPSWLPVCSFLFNKSTLTVLAKETVQTIGISSAISTPLHSQFLMQQIKGA